MDLITCEGRNIQSLLPAVFIRNGNGLTNDGHNNKGSYWDDAWQTDNLITFLFPSRIERVWLTFVCLFLINGKAPTCDDYRPKRGATECDDYRQSEKSSSVFTEVKEKEDPWKWELPCPCIQKVASTARINSAWLGAIDKGCSTDEKGWIPPFPWI